MDSIDIQLTDGSLMPVKINFYTLYLINKAGIDGLSKRKQSLDDKIKSLEHANASSNEISKIKVKIENLTFEMSAKLIYVILRSNGREVTEEQAMMLVPADTEEIERLFTEFGDKMKKLKKKKANKL